MRTEVASLVAAQSNADATTEGKISCRTGRKVMAPVTGSLYVPGTLGDVDSIIVDIGTGYYVKVSPHACPFFGCAAARSVHIVVARQKSIDDGKEFLDRKVALLKVWQR
jgi:hypothetical protein